MPSVLIKTKFAAVVLDCSRMGVAFGFFSYGTHSQNSSKDKTSVDSKLEEVVNII